MGIFSLEEAFCLAKEKNLDLIEISSQVVPPVCRLMDFGKYLYQLEKKQRIQRKKQKITRLKNIRLSLRISIHDLETKINQAKKFLLKNYNVRIEIFLRGREKSYLDFARKKLDDFLSKIKEEIEIKEESETKKTFRGLEIIIRKK